MTSNPDTATGSADPGGAPPQDMGCRENGLLMSRRGFLGVSAGLFTSALLPPGVAMANTGGGNDPRLLVVLLRGGLDGLSTLVPFGDPDYERHRGDLTIARNRVQRLDPVFGLHPALRNLLRLYRNGEVALIPAAGLPVQSRSHFECQANLQNGLPGNVAGATGWVNRLLTALPPRTRMAQRGGVTIGPVPQILAGPAPVMSWTPTWFAQPMPQIVAMLEQIYRGARNADLAAALDRGLAADALASGVAGHVRPSMAPIEQGFRGAARLMGAANGPRMAVLSAAGWDTHNAQGNLSGQIASRLEGLDQGLGAFRAELPDRVWAQTVVICVTEFGRSVHVNGTSGTDHGIGMPVILLGGAVNGGIHGDWPGLTQRALVDGRDLRPTVDLRSVFKGVLRDHLGAGLPALNQQVFPQSAAARPMAGLIRGAPGARDMDEMLAELRATVSPQDMELRDLRSYRVVHGLR